MNIAAHRAAWDILPIEEKLNIWEDLVDYHNTVDYRSEGHECGEYCEMVAKWYVEVEVSKLVRLV